MKTSFKQFDAVEIRKKYQDKVSILPGTKMRIAEFKAGGNIRVIWVDDLHTPYSAIFFDYILKK